MVSAKRQVHDLMLLLSRRGEGHTSCMQVGLDNFRGDAIVIGHDQITATHLAQHRRTFRDMFRTTPVSIQGNMVGLRGAVAIDHSALHTLLGALLAEHAEDRKVLLEHITMLAKQVPAFQRDPGLAQAMLNALAKE